MLNKFDYIKPESLSETLAYLSEHGGDSRILAGGTDLLVLIRRKVGVPSHLIDIKGIEELHRFDYSAGTGVFIGAAVTVNKLVESQIIQHKYLALAEAAHSLASYQLRNRATLVGNICNASPGADLAGPLLVFDAKVHIASTEGTRVVPITEFFLGVKKTVLKPEELVLGVSIPEAASSERSLYFKQTRIKGHDLGIVGLAARLTQDGKFKLAMSSVAPTPIRLQRVEEVLDSIPRAVDLALRAGQEVRAEIKPISDVRASAEYRLHLAGVLLKRAVEQLTSRGGRHYVS